MDTEVDQLRLVAGVRWDMPFLNFGSFGNWAGDFAVVYSDGNGVSPAGEGIREDLLRYSVDTTRVENGQIVCGDATGGPDNAPCVPVDMFAPSLYQNLKSTTTSPHRQSGTTCLPTGRSTPNTNKPCIS